MQTKKNRKVISSSKKKKKNICPGVRFSKVFFRKLYGAEKLCYVQNV